jgi:hypothetical protein
VNSSLAKPGLVLQAEQPVERQERGVGNYGSAGLLASSDGRGWSGLAAELRSHSGVIAKRSRRRICRHAAEGRYHGPHRLRAGNHLAFSCEGPGSCD